MSDRNPAYDGPMGIFADYEGCESGICTQPFGHVLRDGVYYHKNDESPCDELNQPIESP